MLHSEPGDAGVSGAGTQREPVQFPESAGSNGTQYMLSSRQSEVSRSHKNCGVPVSGGGGVCVSSRSELSPSAEVSFEIPPLEVVCASDNDELDGPDDVLVALPLEVGSSEPSPDAE